MVSFARSVSGLLYRSDGTLTGWTGDAEWTSGADPQFVCYPTGNTLLGPNDAEIAGIREPQLYIESGVWYLLYDGGDGSTGWRQFLSRSNDRGLTWERLGPLTDLTKVVGGLWAAIATGWIEKRGSDYWLHRVVAGATFASPNIGLPASPYGFETWTAASILGPWTGDSTVDSLGDWAEGDHQPGCTLKVSSTYHHFLASNDYEIGRLTASAPNGPWTRQDPLILETSTTGTGGRHSENPKAFHSTTLGRYVMLANLINLAVTATDANIIGYSASVSDWSSAIFRRTQRLCPMDDTIAIGIAAHVTAPDGALVEGPGGEVPIVYDARPRAYTPGWHIGRSICTAVLEPSTAALAIAQSANTTNYRIKRTLSHTAAVIELAACYTVQNGGGIEFRVQYRSDSAAANCYAAVLDASGMHLEKVVSSTPSTLASNSGDLSIEAYVVHRLKIAVSGNTHRLYLDGELQVEYTDGSSPITSGTTLGISCQGAALQVHNLSVRTSDTITITGLRSSETVWLRGYGELPICAGSTSITRDHWPHFCLTYQGTDYTVSNALWGGDTLDFSGISTEPLAHAANRVARG